MNRLRRFYNQNRKTVWGIIIIIAFAFALLQLANFFVKRQSEEKLQQAKIQQEQQVRSQTSNTEQTNTIQSNNASSQTTNTTSRTDIIKQFITYCNKKDIEKAYDMISNECKEQMYKNIEDFKRLYYDNTFENQTKDTSIDNWADNTYLVYFKESALATGKVKDENQKGDYITVVKDDENNYKLNINSYIGYKEINKTEEKENMKINVICKNVYMDYEEYTIKATNNSQEEVKLDTLENSESIYIEDSKDMKYPSHNHELSEELLRIPQGHTKELKIKFYSTYSTSRKIKSIVFSELQKNNQTIKFEIAL